MSSLRIDGDCRVTLYEHGDFKGRSSTFSDDMASLEGTVIGNDEATSIRLECGR